MLLSVEDLHSRFDLHEGVLRVVDGVSFAVGERETVGIVGESGCGKTIVALSILGLVPPPGRVVSGRVSWRGEDLRAATAARMQQVRGGEIGLVFQEPDAALNPVIPVGRQLVEVLQAHRPLNRREAELEAIRWLGETGIPEPDARFRAYPFELSGGMRQRAVIALAVCTEPALLLADEPTTALDVTVQRDILDLLQRLQERHRMAMVMISHDLGVISRVADRVLVMYTGKVLEEGPVEEVFRDPRHPYTRGLIDSVPRLGAGRDAPLAGIPGAVPDLLDLPSGCTFHPRCSLAIEMCRERFPDDEHVGPGRRAACYRLEDAPR
jgi:peptide/nickel transport system ATP-binding protein/oligopeptide transport system ATP-binding protein